MSVRPSCRARAFISSTNRATEPRPTNAAMRVRGVVRALDQRRLDQVAQRHALAGTEVDRRLADRGGPRGDRGDVVERCVLERDERGHQLRDRRHREALDARPATPAPRRCRSSGRSTPPRRPAAARRRRRRRARASSARARRKATRFTAARTIYLTRMRWPIVQRDGVDVRIQHQQLLDGGVVLLGDDGERVAGLDLVVLRVGGSCRRLPGPVPLGLVVAGTVVVAAGGAVAPSSSVRRGANDAAPRSSRRGGRRRAPRTARAWRGRASPAGDRPDLRPESRRLGARRRAPVLVPARGRRR